jgi:hypothetical protein
MAQAKYFLKIKNVSQKILTNILYQRFLDINGSALSLEGNLLPEPNKIKKGKGRICCENG